MFKNKQFTVLLASEAISLIGDRILAVALVVLVYDLTGSAATVGLLMMLKAIPSLLLGSVAGALVDRLNRKWVMVFSNLAQGALVLAIPFSGNLIVIYTVYLLLSVINQFFIPARAATLPDLVPKESLMTANSLFSMAFVGAIAIGPMIAGFLIDAYNTDAAFFADSATFLIPAFAVALLALPASKPSPRKTGLAGQMKEGFALIKQTPALWSGLILSSSVYMGIGAISVLGIVISDQILGLSAGGYGTMMSSMGVGMLVGAIASAKLGRKFDRIKLASSGAMLAGLAIMVLPFASNLTVAIIINLAMGVGIVAVQTSVNTTFQSAPADMRGRVMGAAQSLMGAASFLAMGLAGFVAEQVGIAPVLGLIGGISLVAGLLLYKRGG